MIITTKHIGKLKCGASEIIELFIFYDSGTITTTVTQLNGKVPQELIDNLRQVANELEEQNKLLNNG